MQPFTALTANARDKKRFLPAIFILTTFITSACISGCTTSAFPQSYNSFKGSHTGKWYRKNP